MGSKSIGQPCSGHTHIVNVNSKNTTIISSQNSLPVPITPESSNMMLLSGNMSTSMDTLLSQISMSSLTLPIVTSMQRVLHNPPPLTKVSGLEDSILGQQLEREGEHQFAENTTPKRGAPLPTVVSGMSVMGAEQITLGSNVQQRVNK